MFGNLGNGMHLEYMDIDLALGYTCHVLDTHMDQYRKSTRSFHV